MSHEDDFQEPELPQALLPPGFLKDPVHLLAFGLGSGAMARAPGTWGSLAAIPVWYLFAWVPGPVYWGGCWWPSWWGYGCVAGPPAI